jgi:hypothetical protein
MPTLDLSTVTRTLKNLLEQNVLAVGGLSVTVTPAPPDKIGSDDNTLSLHLFHVAEDPYYKNTPGPGNDVPNVAKSPMAVNLYYILTAHHDTSDPDLDPYTQQRIMGLAMKTLHDFPVITDETVINGSATPVLHPGLLGDDNPLQIIMRPMSPEDAMTFWTTEEQQTTRLSAYYEVRVVMLEPEPPRSMPGTVFAVGTYLVAIGSPALACSRNVVSFSLPPGTGVTVPQRIESTPARVSTDVGDPAFPNNRFELLGTELTIGKSRQLILRNPLWQRQGFDAAAVDPGLNPTWQVSFQPDRIEVDLQPSLTVSGAAVLTLFPGIYSASLRVIRDEEVVLGQLKQIADASNETTLFVTPRIASNGPLGGDNRVTVELVPGFDLTHGAGTDEALDIRLLYAGRVYERGFIAAPSDPGDNDGRYDVAVNSVTFQVDSATTAAGEHPFRLVVNGAETQPYWIEIP